MAPPYTKHVWTNNAGEAINDTNLNEMEEGIYQASLSDSTAVLDVWANANISVANVASNVDPVSIGTSLNQIDVENTTYVDWNTGAGTLTIVKSGFYRAKLGTDWDIDATSVGFVQPFIIVEAGATVDDVSKTLSGPPFPANATDVIYLNCEETCWFDAGDVLTPSAKNTTGSSRNITGGEFWMRAIHP